MGDCRIVCGFEFVAISCLLLAFSSMFIADSELVERMNFWEVESKVSFLTTKVSKYLHKDHQAGKDQDISFESFV